MGRTSPCSSAARFALVALLAALICELTSTASSRAGAPCWQTLVTDWSDGRIDGTYPVACYRKAIKALPEDARLYSNAVSDITRALQRRVHATRAVTGVVSQRDPALEVSKEAARDGSGTVGPAIRIGGLLALLVTLLVGGMFVARRKLPTNR